MKTAAAPDIDAFIRRNLKPGPALGLPEIQLYRAHPASGLGRLGRDDHDPAPYWAYLWGGGAALARHVLDHPDVVAGRRVFDLGAGGGVVGIAAAKSGAASVLAVDIDPNALAAARVNAELNNVQIGVAPADLSAPPESVDLILAGDVFYSPELAEQSCAFLRLCREGGKEVLIGDPGRKSLPRDRLAALAEYPVADFGVSGTVRGEVFAFEPWREPLPAGYAGP